MFPIAFCEKFCTEFVIVAANVAPGKTFPALEVDDIFGADGVLTDLLLLELIFDKVER
jgi:hypothetical protein